jgi:hypothetical protein
MNPMKRVVRFGVEVVLGGAAMAALFAVLVLLAGCGGTDVSELTGSQVCVPRRQVECACPGGAVGVQACSRDGSGYDACACSSGDAGTATEGSAGAGGAGGSTGGSGGAGGACTPRACPASEQVEAPRCGPIDNGCGGTLNCGCEFGACDIACSCWHLQDFDADCAHVGYPALAIQCANDKRPKTTYSCNVLPTNERPIPAVTFCCRAL